MSRNGWIVVALACGAAVPASAVPAVQTGLVGIARLQTARLSVINLAAPDPSAPRNPCVLFLSFQDERGATFRDGSGAPLVERASLEPGASAFLELPSSLVFAGSTAARRLIRASVDVNPGPPDLPPNPCAEIATTLEVYDTLTGRTAVGTNPGPPTVTPGPPTTEPGPPNAPLGLLGLARLQLASLNVVNLSGDVAVPPNPCVVTLAFLQSDGAPFLDRDGRPLSAEVHLLPGESAVLELPASLAFGRAAGLRSSFRGLVEVQPGPPEPGDSCASARATVEIVDRLTARTSVVLDAAVVSRRMQ